jgi:PKD repeat protein
MRFWSPRWSTCARPDGQRNRSARSDRLRSYASLALGALVLAQCAENNPTEPAPATKAAASAIPGTAAVNAHVPGRVLALFQPGADRVPIAAAHGATPQREVVLGVWLLQVPEGREQAIAAALGRDPNVVFAEPDWIRTISEVPCKTGTCAVPNDPYFPNKWDLHNDGDVPYPLGGQISTGKVDADIDWLEAYNQLGAGFSGAAKIGILDTGIRSTHLDLCGKVVAQHDFANGDAYASDDHGHGTHVAGIAAACANNGRGVAGVAYGSNIQLLAVKVCTADGNCTSSAISEGIKWAADRGANVLNLSLAGSTASSTEQVALQYAQDRDVLPFCAAGNNGTATVLYPAAFPECVAVTSTNWGDGRASYSSYGAEAEISAPGGDTEDFFFGSSYVYSTTAASDDSYGPNLGTSMATPQAAGLGALLYALGVGSAADVRERIRATVDDLGSEGWDPEFGFGRINVFNAINGLDGGTVNFPPIASFTHSCEELACSFTDASTDPDGTVVAWSWDFGDGTGSTARNPSHTYARGGTYTVVLTVTDDGEATSSTSRSVEAYGGPFVDPSSLPGLAMWLRADAISGLSDGVPISTWEDQSGRGHHASQASASKQPTYRTDIVNGRPALHFDATDDGMSTTLNPSGMAQTVFFVWSFAATSRSWTYLMNAGGSRWILGVTSGKYFGYTGSYMWGDPYTAGRWVVQTVRQSDALAEMWIDGTGRATTTSVQDPGTVHFAASGSYTNPLDGYIAEVIWYDRTLTNQERTEVESWLAGKYFGSGGPTNSPPTASFTSSCTDLVCSFTDTSTDPDGTVTAWSWDFGDGGGSNAQHPSHTYSVGGTYSVALTVTDDDGATSTTSQSVTVSAPNSAPTAAFTHACTDLACAFTDQSTDADGAVVAWSWSFGDGAASTAQNPSYTYTSEGTYTVTLTVTDDDGAENSASQNVSVTAPSPPSAGITLSATGYKVRGVQHTDLTWSGATSASIDVYRNGSRIATTANDGSYTDSIGQRGGGSYAYRVCEAGTQTCSEEVTVKF